MQEQVPANEVMAQGDCPAWDAIAEIVELTLLRRDELETHPVGTEMVRRAELARSRLFPVE